MFEELRGKNILLLAHENADLDSFCSASMLQDYLGSKNIKASIGVPSHINEQANAFALKQKITFTLNPNLKDFDVVMLFDFNDFEQLGKIRVSFVDAFEKKLFKVIAFDHHVIEKTAICKKGCFIEEEAVSTTQVIYNLFKNNSLQKEFSKKMFFYACIGIVEDTGHFLVSTNESFECFADCLKRSGNAYAEVLSFAKHNIPEGERIAFLKAAQRSNIVKISSKTFSREIIIVTSNLSFYQGAAATKLLDFGAQISLVVGKEKNGFTHLAVRVESALKEKTKFNSMKHLLPLISEKFGGECGGHSGAAQWKGKADETEVLEEAVKLVRNYFK